MACQEARRLWGISEVTGPVEWGSLREIQQGWRERKKSPMTPRNVDNILLSLVFPKTHLKALCNPHIIEYTHAYI